PPQLSREEKRRRRRATAKYRSAHATRSESAWRPSTWRSQSSASCCPPCPRTRNSPRSRSCAWPSATSPTSTTCWTCRGPAM
ncbi:unnamed protein product, partial [Staurois parvus]